MEDWRNLGIEYNSPKYWRWYRKKNKERISKNRKKRYPEHKKQVRDWYRKKRQEPEYRKRLNKAARKYRRNLRKKVLKRLGGKCAQCGFTDWRALQIDHINGDGSRDKYRGQTAVFHRFLMKASSLDKYQILCANCNWIKRYDKKEDARYK